MQVQTRQLSSRPSTRHKDLQFHSFLSQCILFATNYYNSLLLNTQLLHWRRPHAVTLNMHQNTTTHAGGINPVPVHAKKAYRGSGGIAPLILNLRGVNFTPQPLQITPVHTGWVPHSVWTFWKRQKPVFPTGEDADQTGRPSNVEWSNRGCTECQEHKMNTKQVAASW